MKKTLVSLSLTLALCLSLAVPALAAEPYVYEDEELRLTNVIARVVSQAESGSTAFTCVAPVELTLPPDADGITELILGKVDEDYDATADNVYETPFRYDDLVETDGLRVTLTEPGRYIVERDVRPDPDSGLCFSRYLLIVQAAGNSDPSQPNTAPPDGAGFTDVKQGDWFYAPVRWAVEKGITTGTSATTFSPNQNCTTAQILTFLWRANGSPKPAGSNPFSDVKSGDYYAGAAVWAYEKGMVSGGSFGGGAPCTRSMAVTYLWKAAGSPAAKAAGFTDVPAGADYAKAVSWAVEKGVTTGTSATAFSPNSVCTRGQIVTFLYRASNPGAPATNTPATNTPGTNTPVIDGKAPVTDRAELYGTYTNSRYKLSITPASLTPDICFEVWAFKNLSDSIVRGRLIVAEENGTLNAKWNGLSMTFYQGCVLLEMPDQYLLLNGMYTKQ